MDGQLKDEKSLIARIQQVEHERDELRKDIEQLCMQQAGPSYVAAAARMHFQRTTGLEQEIENLKSNLAACTREKSNLQEELSEAYRIKGQLADLHAAEVSKNMEAEKQLKFFQSCVAAAFAERDHSIMQAEKAKEKEEVMLQKLNPLERRVEELAHDFLEENKVRAALQIDLEEQSKQNKIFKKVINRFYEIRQSSLDGSCEERSWVGKCECLLHDSPEKWVFSAQGETPTSKYISAIEAEVQTLMKSVDNLQNKLYVGLEIENHLKKRVYDLEKKKTLLEEAFQKGILQLLHCHSQHKAHIMNILNEECSYLKSIIDVVEEKIRQLGASRERSWKPPAKDVLLDENNYQDFHVNIIAGPDLIDENIPGSANSIASGDVSEALAQALQEKVSALLLLSQQEERHLLERNVNAALQKKIEELQRNLLQVTNEKVKALMEFAQLKQEYQRFQEETNYEMKQGTVHSEIGGRKIFHETDGRLKNLLKKTYLKRWIGSLDPHGDEAEAHLNYAGNVSDRSSSYSIDIARMKIENATLKESLESIEHLTSAVRRLRSSLLKVKESVSSEVTISGTLEAVNYIICEANLVKTALGSSLPVSWSAEASDIRSFGENSDQETVNAMASSSEKIDFVSAAGFEMVEIVMLAAQMLKEHINRKDEEDESFLSHEKNEPYE